MTIGTYSVADLLSVKTSGLQYGLDAIAAALQAEIDVLNQTTAEMLSLYAEASEDVRRMWGTSADFTWHEADEFVPGMAQKATVGTPIMFPLRELQLVTGFTSRWMKHASVADIAVRARLVEDSYVRRLRDEIQFALFNPNNYSVVNKLGDGLSLDVKAFLNADGDPIPNGADGTAFAGTHSHYTGTSGASLAYTDIDTLIANVVEHGNMRDVYLYVNESNVATLAGLASTKFVAATPITVLNSQAATATVERLDLNADSANRFVGTWGGYPVYTRSWVPANYYAVIAAGSVQKPLVRRLDTNASLNGLRMASRNEQHPLTAEFWEAEIGFGAWNRAAAAFLQGNQQTTYTSPTTLWPTV